MGQVTVNVNGRNYRMSCADGAEKRVLALAAFIEGLVKEIKGGLKLVQEERLYLMAAIMVADELWDTREELQKTLMQLAELRTHHVVDGSTYLATREVTRIIESAAARLETLNANLAKTA